jgi:nucleoside-triphosphatase
VTREIRDGRRRVGFAIRTSTGEEGILAHTRYKGPPRVGRYGVDVPEFERIVLPVLRAVPKSGIVVIDELGKMELASERFRAAVDQLYGRAIGVVATVHAHHHPFTDRLKCRDDVEVWRVTRGNRDELPERILAFLDI